MVSCLVYLCMGINVIFLGCSAAYDAFESSGDARLLDEQVQEPELRPFSGVPDEMQLQEENRLLRDALAREREARLKDHEVIRTYVALCSRQQDIMGAALECVQVGLQAIASRLDQSAEMSQVQPISKPAKKRSRKGVTPKRHKKTKQNCDDFCYCDDEECNCRE